MSKPDWRKGLIVKPRLASDPFAGELAVVVKVHASRTKGIVDRDGVLELLLLSGATAFVAADRWITA